MQHCITRLIREPAGPQMDGLLGCRVRCPVDILAGVAVNGGAAEKGMTLALATQHWVDRVRIQRRKHL